MNREAWLQAAIDIIRPWFAEQALALPETIHISVGFPSRGALRTAKEGSQRLGECWRHSVSADNSPQIYINPTIADGLRVLDIVVHELVHAALPDAGHKSKFLKAAQSLGLEGKAKATTATPGLVAKLEDVVRAIGVYPHPALNPTMVEAKKQTTRMVKVTCASPQCASEDGIYAVRMTRLWLTKFGPPLCPNCEALMVADEAAVEALAA